MRIAFALLGAPMIALVDQSVAYAVVSWSCAHGSTLLMHLVHFVSLVATVVAAILAFGAWRGTLAAESVLQSHFLAGVATASATLSALTIAAMWMPVWMVSSCIA